MKLTWELCSRGRSCLPWRGQRQLAPEGLPKRRPAGAATPAPDPGLGQGGSAPTLDADSSSCGE